MSGQGSASLTKHRQGKRLTPVQAIHAKCCECLCDYADGRFDCEIPTCPLHPFMAYCGRVANAQTDHDCMETPPLPPPALSKIGVPTGPGAADE